VLTQNFGLRDGLPGTVYNKGVRAVEGIEAILIPVLREALADEEEVMKQGTILGRLMQGLKEEGADIMHASRDEKVAFYATECVTLMFAGAPVSLEQCYAISARNMRFLPMHPSALNPRMHA
jgi:hypothetical protein